jgi:hypothetical protein
MFQGCIPSPRAMSHQKRYFTSTRLHGAMFHKAVMFTLAAARTWNLRKEVTVYETTQCSKSSKCDKYCGLCSSVLWSRFQRFGGTRRLHFARNRLNAIYSRVHDITIRENFKFLYKHLFHIMKWKCISYCHTAANISDGFHICLYVNIHDIRVQAQRRQQLHLPAIDNVTTLDRHMSPTVCHWGVFASGYNLDTIPWAGRVKTGWSSRGVE